MILHPSARGLRARALVLAAVPLLALAAAARADDARVPLLPKYQQECGSCHAPYPPGMLPAVSWQRLMANLPSHFGTDASLDAATLAELRAWLDRHAGTSRRVQRDPTPPPEDRITRAPWFVREHDEVRAATWALPAVKSASNCAACHTQADQGDYRERNIRIPR